MLNNTTSFLLPVFNKTFKYKELESLGFKNCYIQDHGLVKGGDVYEGCLFLLFNYKIVDSEVDPEFIKFGEKLVDKDFYVFGYSPEDNYFIHILKFPEEYIFEYNCFILGKYSRFRREEFCDKFYNKTDPQYKICTKDKTWWIANWGRVLDIDDADEYHSKPNLINEIYRYDEKIYENTI